MQFPIEIQNKINELFGSYRKSELSEVQKNLTNKYKCSSGRSASLIESKNDSILYAISRMPATYSVIYTLLGQLIEQGALEVSTSIADIGSGTGAGYFACRELFGDIEIQLFERDNNMIEVFEMISETKGLVRKIDVIKDNIRVNSDFNLVIASYILSEMTENDRLHVVDKLLQISSRYLLLIDTGTPETYTSFMKIKNYVEGKGYKIIAPCRCEACPLENDYCQFYARVERSALHRAVKGAKQSYEDEKYFYLLIAKENCFETEKGRVIRRPTITDNVCKLKLCTKNGVFEKTFTKRDKQDYKLARKCKINDLI